MKKTFSLLLLFTLTISTSTVSFAVSPDDSDSEAAAQRLMGWEVTGPMGGDVRSLVVDPQDPQRLYFGTIDGQIYTSADGGLMWERLSGFNRPGLLIDNIIVDARDSKTLYAAAHRHKEPGGFFKTTDGGRTWKEAEQLKGEAVHALTQSPKDPDLLLAGTNRGIFRSADAGESWEQLPTSATPGLVNIESLA
ncbi:MAG TPA: hypothetical protein VF064_08100, partial [Pyrinomonadaceae bacterium]